jgi:hypothetical protein
MATDARSQLRELLVPEKESHALNRVRYYPVSTLDQLEAVLRLLREEAFDGCAKLHLSQGGLNGLHVEESIRLVRSD